MSNELRLGKYRLVAELGSGGMADVFLAMIEGPVGSGFAKLAVVKRLRANLADDPDFVTMLIDEARITARLNHPNLVQLLEVGTENEEYFLAMEYLDGQPLHRIERRAARCGSPLGSATQIAILLDVLAGLHHAHELVDYDGTPLNIVHRDITPHNIFVTYDGQVKVMDFGIAKAAGRAQETQHGIVKGKVRFMSPEQAMGQALDRRADIFAVGILLWQAATGRRFWGELDEFAIVQQLIAGEYVSSPKEVNGDVPDEIDRICRRALARNADERYEDATQMRADLEAFIGATGYEARRELRTLAGDLFAKERRDLREVVEKVGKQSLSITTASVSMLAQRTSGSSSNAVLTMTQSVPPPKAITLVPPALSTAPATLDVASTTPSAAPPSGAARRVVVGASLALAAVSCFLAVAATNARSSARSEAVAAANVVVPDMTRLGTTPLRSRAHTAPAQNTPAPPATVVVVVSRLAPAPSPVVAAPSPRPAIPALQTPRGSRGRLNLDANDPWAAK